MSLGAIPSINDPPTPCKARAATIGARLELTPHRAEAPVKITNPRRKSLPGARRSPNRPLVRRSETFIRR